MNRKKNTALFIASTFLLIALFDGWPYGFFTLLRFVVFVSSVYVAYLSYKDQREAWSWTFLFIAILFNPFIPIHLGREVWKTVDLGVGVFMIASSFTLKLNSTNKL